MPNAEGRVTIPPMERHALQGGAGPAEPSASPPAPGARRSALAPWIVFACLALLVTALDLWSKHAVFRLLRVQAMPTFTADPPRVVLPNFFEIEASVNTGAFSGWFSGRIGFLSTLSAVALVAIVWFLRGHLRAGRPRPVAFAVALGLLWGGTCGNLYDRSTLGYVRDFVKWFHVGSPVEESDAPGAYRLFSSRGGPPVLEARIAPGERVGFEKTPSGAPVAVIGGHRKVLEGGQSYSWRRVRIWPNFNVADSSICVGVGLVLLLFLREPKAESAGKGDPPVRSGRKER
jgi:lipoprotein signal peptidase